MLPFSSAEFLHVFERYNSAVWPAQVLIHLAGLIAIAVAVQPRRMGRKLISFILGALWLWMGVVYHWTFFSGINKAALLFGGLFVVQSLIFIFVGLSNSSLTFELRSGAPRVFGAVLVTYALVGYPIIGMAFGHAYPAAPTFGVPCPTTIFTFGLLLAAGIRVRFYVLIIPILWSVIGLSATVYLGMYEDLGLAVSLLGAGWIVSLKRKFFSKHLVPQHLGQRLQ